MDRDEDGDPLFPEALSFAEQAPAETFIKGFMIRRVENIAKSRRGFLVPGLELLLDTTDGLLRLVVTRNEASAIANGITEVLCDG